MTKIRVGLGLMLLAALGCADGGPPLVAVSGRVTLDGKPLVGKTLQFLPEPGTPGQGAGATTGPNGSYTLLAARPGATRDMPGTPAGAYRVIVTEPMFPIDLPVQDANDPKPIPAIGLPSDVPQKKPAIPSVYGKAATTPLLVEVPKVGGVIDLQLLSSPDSKRK